MELLHYIIAAFCGIVGVVLMFIGIAILSVDKSEWERNRRLVRSVPGTFDTDGRVYLSIVWNRKKQCLETRHRLSDSAIRSMLS